MAFKFLPIVPDCCFCVSLPTAALLIALIDILFTIANVVMFYLGMICNQEFCQSLWVQVLFLAPYAWLCLTAAALVISYVTKEEGELLMFAIVVKMILVIVFLVILILIFINDEIHHDLKQGAIFLSLGFAYLFVLVYFIVIMNSWHSAIQEALRE